MYIWSTYHDLSKFTSVRRDRNDFWEGIKGKMTRNESFFTVKDKSVWQDNVSVNAQIFVYLIRMALFSCKTAPIIYNRLHNFINILIHFTLEARLRC